MIVVVEVRLIQEVETLHSLVVTTPSMEIKITTSSTPISTQRIQKNEILLNNKNNIYPLIMTIVRQLVKFIENQTLCY